MERVELLHPERLRVVGRVAEALLGVAKAERCLELDVGRRQTLHRLEHGGSVLAKRPGAVVPKEREAAQAEAIHRRLRAAGVHRRRARGARVEVADHRDLDPPPHGAELLLRAERRVRRERRATADLFLDAGLRRLFASDLAVLGQADDLCAGPGGERPRVALVVVVAVADEDRLRRERLELVVAHGRIPGRGRVRGLRVVRAAGRRRQAVDERVEEEDLPVHADPEGRDAQPRDDDAVLRQLAVRLDVLGSEHVLARRDRLRIERRGAGRCGGRDQERPRREEEDP